MSEQGFSEAGERRRRREEERRRLLAEQARHDAGDGSAPSGPAQGLTRRELRERTADAADPSPPVVGSSPSRDVGPYPPEQRRRSREADRGPAPGWQEPSTPRPAPVSAPAPAPEPPLSRRELRDRAAAGQGEQTSGTAGRSRPEPEQRWGAQPSQPEPPVRPQSAPSFEQPAPPAQRRAMPAPPSDPIQTRASRRERPDQPDTTRRFGREAPEPAPQPAPEATPTPEPTATYITPQQRAAAIRAQAARVQAEREEAARQQTERFQSQRPAAQPQQQPVRQEPQHHERPYQEAPRPTGGPQQPPASMWTQRSQGQPVQPMPPGMPQNGHSTGPSGISLQEPPVRRVVLPAAAPDDGEPDQPTQITSPFSPAPDQRPPSAGWGQGAPNGAPAPTPHQQAPSQHQRAPSQPARQSAFVAPGQAPAAGQPIGTVTITPTAPAQPQAQPQPQARPEPRPQFQPQPMPQPRPETPAGMPADPSGPLPRWGSVEADGPSWGVPAPAATQAPPARPKVEPERMFTPAPFPATTASAEELDEAEYDAPRHPYSWLHMVVLILVAFVLGVLIYMVMSRESGGASAQAGEVAVTVLASALGPVAGV